MNRTEEFKHLFLRDLDKFIAGLEAFPTEASLWEVRGEILNSAGTLGLHIAGNLQHFIGALLGGSGYVRDRDREFSEKKVPRTEILAQLNAARQAVEATLGKMPEEQLTEKYPVDKFFEERSVHFTLLHLLAHLNYHLGQLNYLRRGA